MSGHLLSSFCSAHLVFGASQSCHNLSPTRLLPCPTPTYASISSQAVLSWPPAHTVTQLLQLLIPDRYSFSPCIFSGNQMFVLVFQSCLSWFYIGVINHTSLVLLPVGVQCWVHALSGRQSGFLLVCFAAGMMNTWDPCRNLCKCPRSQHPHAHRCQTSSLESPYSSEYLWTVLLLPWLAQYEVTVFVTEQQQK